MGPCPRYQGPTVTPPNRTVSKGDGKRKRNYNTTSVKQIAANSTQRVFVVFIVNHCGVVVDDDDDDDVFAWKQ